MARRDNKKRLLMRLNLSTIISPLYFKYHPLYLLCRNMIKNLKNGNLQNLLFLKSDITSATLKWLRWIIWNYWVLNTHTDIPHLTLSFLIKVMYPPKTIKFNFLFTNFRISIRINLKKGRNWLKFRNITLQNL